jgi:hypothetical protein
MLRIGTLLSGAYGLPPGEAPDDRRALVRREDLRHGIGCSVTVALEIAHHAYALGVIAPVPGVHPAAVGLELVDEPRGGEAMRGQPAADIAKGGGNDHDRDGNQRVCAEPAGRRRAGSRRRVHAEFLATSGSTTDGRTTR